MSRELGTVRFGVAGWSYADWKGIVYPRGCKDTLRAVAERLDLIEINSTFYALPSAKNCASWVERTEDLGTAFTAKLPREFTHAAHFGQAEIEASRAGFAPLAASGRLCGLLAQFDYRFEAVERSFERVARLVDAFAPLGVSLFVELRHRSWNAADALARLAASGVGVLELDYPGMVGGFSRDVSTVRAAGVAYFRLHGRNRSWFDKAAGRDEVYDWRYSDFETDQIWARLQRIRASASEAIVVANNHFHGKAMEVVRELLERYRGEAEANDRSHRSVAYRPGEPGGNGAEVSGRA
ncbi:MAG: DUF72 domain-containing protein [Planctomycetota bacterium]